MVFLVILLIIVIIFLIGYFYLKNKIETFLMKYFNTKSLSEVIEKTELEAENSPKSISSMESLYKDRIKKDFPEVNLNELKGMVEKVILDSFSAIESGDISKFKYDSLKPVSFVDSKINDYKDKNVSFSNIRFHKTALSRYYNEDGIATMVFQTSFEYSLSLDGKRSKKVQDRYRVEFIYIIDSKKAKKKAKSLGLNCPNCGAPITDVGIKVCKYCGSGNVEVVKRVWVLNNIEKY